jgi:hypothetical protein
MDKPQIIVYAQRSLNYTAFDVKWIPSSPRFVVLGQQANGTGILQVMRLQQGTIEIVNQVRNSNIDRKTICLQVRNFWSIILVEATNSDG